ncbi:MAG TPA: alpha-ketoglutarate-dependent dioxygenase AlkB [Planctomycetaceae bacterium]|nr:alpha-ketoglutarate-dependent dioxygenase AlkB [Planctomycetaceae bacterium]
MAALRPFRDRCTFSHTPGVGDHQEDHSLQRIELRDGGILLYDASFLSADEADRSFAELRDQVSWEQKPAFFGHMQPRLTASFGDTGTTYRYSGTVNIARTWTPLLVELKKKIEAVLGTYNYCLLNRYRSGADSVGWHADNEPEMGDVIGSLSLGATRTFQIRHNITKETQSMIARNGSLIIMAGTMQQFWKHTIPKTTKPVGERINLTFRHIRSKE